MAKPKRMATCHPDRQHYAKGLCRKCYTRNYYYKRLEDPEYIKKERERSRKYYEEYPEVGRKWRVEHLEQGRKWYKEHLEQKRMYDRKRYEEHPEYHYGNHLKRTYGISSGDYDNMISCQNGGCAICRKTPEENGRRLAVDHNHETGQVRGLLCNDCNRALGCFKENTDLLVRAIEYLNEHRSDNEGVT